MKIAIITRNFPHPRFPQSGAFVQKLADGMAKNGVKVNVYFLVSTVKFLLRRKSPVELHFAEGVKVKNLGFIGFSNINFLGLSSAEIGYQHGLRRVRKQLEKDINLDIKPDVLYGKFLLTGGRYAVELSQKFSIPAVADLGESTLLESLSSEQIFKAREIVKGLAGAVCVSPRLVSEMIQLGMEPKRIIMLPNGIDNTKFFPFDVTSARMKLGLPMDKKIVLFVGHFIQRKGPDRVLRAIEKLPPEYCGVFLGEGSINLDSPRVLFKGRVANDVLNTWLNAADTFCLPTLAEGSCNSIEEARAVGLPIVTSNIPDITDFESSQEYILIDPLNIDSIAQGILSACSTGRTKYKNIPLSNFERSKAIMEWLSSTVNLEVGDITFPNKHNP